MARRLNPVAVADHANRQPFDSEILLTQIDHDRLEFVVLRQQLNHVAVFFQAFDRHFVFDARHHDLAVAHILRFVHRQQIAIRMPMSRIDMPFTRSKKSALGLNREGSTW